MSGTLCPTSGTHLSDAQLSDTLQSDTCRIHGVGYFMSDTSISHKIPQRYNRSPGSSPEKEKYQLRLNELG